MAVFAGALLLAACGGRTSSTGNATVSSVPPATSATVSSVPPATSATVSSVPPATSATTSSLPSGVIAAAEACERVVGREPSNFYSHVEQVHLVLTSYEKGEIVESGGDVNEALPTKTLVWVVEVHAKAINWNHSMPAGATVPELPDTDFSVVMNAHSGLVTDAGECRCWPLPLWRVGTVASLPPDC